MPEDVEPSFTCRQCRVASNNFYPGDIRSRHLICKECRKKKSRFYHKRPLSFTEIMLRKYRRKYKEKVPIDGFAELLEGVFQKRSFFSSESFPNRLVICKILDEHPMTPSNCLLLSKSEWKRKQHLLLQNFKGLSDTQRNNISLFVSKYQYFPLDWMYKL